MKNPECPARQMGCDECTVPGSLAELDRLRAGPQAVRGSRSKSSAEGGEAMHAIKPAKQLAKKKASKKAGKLQAGEKGGKKEARR